MWGLSYIICLYTLNSKIYSWVPAKWPNSQTPKMAFASVPPGKGWDGGYDEGEKLATTKQAVLSYPGCKMFGSTMIGRSSGVCVCARFIFKIWVCLSLLWVSASLFVNTASYVCQRITFGHTINLDNVRWGRKKHKINDNNSQDKDNDSHEKHLERGKQNTSKYTSYLYLYFYLQTPQHTPKRLTAGI